MENDMWLTVVNLVKGDVVSQIVVFGLVIVAIGFCLWKTKHKGDK